MDILMVILVGSNIQNDIKCLVYMTKQLELNDFVEWDVNWGRKGIFLRFFMREFEQ
jgi:hypothetical protein